MPIANLFQAPTNAQELALFSFAHMDHERNLTTAIYQQFGVQLPLYALDPIPTGTGPDVTLWAQLHQQQHAARDALLGIGYFDLTEVDFSSPDAMAGWVRQNAALHQAEGLALGVP